MPTRRNKLYLNSKTPILLACTQYNKASLINKQCRIQVDADNADDDVYTANESSPCRRLTLPWPLPCLDRFQNRISWSLYGMVTPFKSYKHWTTRSWDLALTRISDWRTDNPERTQRRSIRYSPVHTQTGLRDRSDKTRHTCLHIQGLKWGKSSSTPLIILIQLCTSACVSAGIANHLSLTFWISTVKGEGEKRKKRRNKKKDL